MNILTRIGICPNCGNPNYCDLIQENNNGMCWCFGKPIFNEKLTVDLGSDPNRQCFCESCISQCV